MRKVKTMKSCIDCTVPKSVKPGDQVPANYVYRKKQKREFAYRNLLLIQNIGREMTRPMKPADPISTFSLNRDFRKRELVRITRENQVGSK